jgi:predicted MPP superfamily phosphohydrolase
MQNAIVRVLILTLFCLYTVFKVIEIWPSQVQLAAFLTLVFFFLMNAWLFIYHAKPILVDKPWFMAFVWLGSTAMGLWATFILLSIPFDIGFLIYYLLAVYTKLIPHHPANIFLLAGQINFFILILSTVIILLGYIEVLRGPKIKSISLSIPALPAALNNFKIVQLSDLHVGPTIRRKYIEKIVRRTNSVAPNIVVLTGDIADAKACDIALDLEPLQELTDTNGKFYVTGNHEYYWDPVGLMDEIKKLGFIVLVNNNNIINVKDAKILIAGIPDTVGGKFLNGHQPDLKQAIRSDEKTDFKILLAHRPDYCIEAEKLGFNLQFSGHTHGGQFFPFNLVVSLAHQYYRKLNKHGRLWLYVNPGTGYWGPANRFGIPAEITLLTLRTEN